MLSFSSMLGLKLTAPQLLAIWGHNTVFDPSAGYASNEIASAAYLVSCVSPSNEKEEADVRTAHNIILDLIDHEPTSDEAKYVIDLDLMDLAADESRFCYCATMLRKEFHGADDLTYAVNRLEYFERLMERKYIFCSEEFRKDFEIIARKNIMVEAVQLRMGI